MTTSPLAAGGATVAPGGCRERLLEAMVVVVARHGYAGATVARVVEQAGASRATFYEHFSNREDCFLAAQAAAAERALRCIGADGSTEVRLAYVLEDVLVRAAENPAATRLLLIETPGATPAARGQFDHAFHRVEAVIEASLGADPVPQLPTSALLDGVAGVIAARLLSDRAATLPQLRGDLIGWGRAYAVPSPEGRLSQDQWTALGRSLPPAEPGREPDPSLLPRGRSALDADAGAASRRRRLVVATAQAVASKGFAALTVADIVAAARVPRSAFYAQFSGKEGAFLAVQEEVLGEAMAAAAGRYVAAADWPQRVWNGLQGLLYYIAERPDLARAGIVEVQSAGMPALRRSLETSLAFTLFLEEGFRRCPRFRGKSGVVSEAIAFAIQGVMRRTILERGAGRLPEQLPLCSHIALAPFLGPDQSLEFVTERARAAC
jgi:AcrR family transcriptional regulator